MAPALAAEIACAANVPAGWVATSSPTLYPSGRKPIRATCQTALLQGQIEPGDYDRFKDIVERNHPFLSDIYVNSPGGDVLEAMRIGRLIRKLLLEVTAPSYLDTEADREQAANPSSRVQARTSLWLIDTNLNQQRVICSGAPDACGCASACILIWVAGGKRNGDVLGLHRPTFKDQRFASMGADEAQRAYRNALEAMTQYLKEMEAPTQFADDLVNTPSSDVTWTEPVDTIASAGSNYGYPPSIAEWLVANCGSYTAQQKLGIIDFVTRKSGGEALSKEDIKLEGDANERVSSTMTCQYRKLANHRDSVSPE